MERARAVACSHHDDQMSHASGPRIDTAGRAGGRDPGQSDSGAEVRKRGVFKGIIS